MTGPDDVIAALGLEPHPEGGWFRETWREPATTAIYYLLRAGERSHWHRVDATEIWHFYGGDPLELTLSPDGRQIDRHVLGPDLTAGQRPQLASRPAPGSRPVLSAGGRWPAARWRPPSSSPASSWPSPAGRPDRRGRPSPGSAPATGCDRAHFMEVLASMTIRVGVFGAGGRMGSTVCRAVAEDPELQLVAGVDPFHSGLDLRGVTGAEVSGLQVSPDVESLARAEAEVAIDFTHLDAARANLAWCGANGVHAVVGTTGFTQADYDDLATRFTRSNCFIAPNFAIGAVLMMRFAELAAPYFETAEIIELHHDQKVDAPSGTAMLTAERMAAASAEWGADPTEKHVLAGARGGEGPGGIHVHSVRLRGLVAHQEVLLGTAGQSLTIRHDSYDRASFMPGVLLAVKAVASRPGVTVGLDALLDI